MDELKLISERLSAEGPYPEAEIESVEYQGYSIEFSQVND